MADTETLKRSAACLGAMFPAFVAQELAALTDSLAAAIQSVTDPLALLSEQSVEGIVEDVGALSEGDITGNLSGAAAGLITQYAAREAAEFVSTMQEKYPNATQKFEKVANKSEAFLNGTWTALSLFPDMPFAAAQRVCNIMIRVIDLKVANLECAKKHTTQVVNLILVILKNLENYADSTFEEIAAAKEFVTAALAEIDRSRRLVDGLVRLDTAALTRAQTELREASKKISPPSGDLSVLDVPVILVAGSEDQGYASLENRALTTLVVPGLARLLEQEAFAYRQHVDVINRYLDAFSTATANYRAAGNSNRLAEQRNRAITSIRNRLQDLCDSMEKSVGNRGMRRASFLMIQWVSRIKSIIAEINRINVNELQEGSFEGPIRAAELRGAYQQALGDLISLNNSETLNGVENPIGLQTQLTALAKGVLRVLDQIDEGVATESSIATLHGLAASIANTQIGRIDESIALAEKQRIICNGFSSIDMAVRERFEEMVNSAHQLGFDRAADLLSSGRYETIMELDIEGLSYIGVAIQCLTEALQGIDDSRTRQRVTDIRDDLVGRQTVLEVAADDSVQAGILGRVDKIQNDIDGIQKSAETVKSIYEQLKSLLEKAGETVESIEEAIDESEDVQAFKDKVDRLDTDAGGRLASALETFSKHANAGVVLCD